MAAQLVKVAKTSKPRGSAPGERRGGRKKGIPNKVNAAKRAEIEASGLTPLDFMLSVLRDEDKPFDARFEAAKASAPYVHAKLSTIDANVTGDMSFTVVINKP